MLRAASFQPRHIPDLTSRPDGWLHAESSPALGTSPPSPGHPARQRPLPRTPHLPAKPAPSQVQKRTKIRAAGKSAESEIQLGYALYLLQGCALDNAINQLCFGKTLGKQSRHTASITALTFT